MYKLSLCIEMVFPDRPLVKGIQESKKIGFDAIEFWEWENKDISAISRECDKEGIAVGSVVANIDENNGSLVDPNKRNETIRKFRGSFKAAEKLKCGTVIAMAGKELPGVSRAKQRQSIIDGLKAVAPEAAEANVQIVLEPLNILVDHKGFYLSTMAEAVDIIEQVGHPNVKIIYDIYHEQIMEGNLINTIRANISKIGYFHAADVPGRHEPGTGEINYTNVARAINDLGYGGYIGLEFTPLRAHEISAANALRLMRAI